MIFIYKVFIIAVLVGSITALNLSDYFLTSDLFSNLPQGMDYLVYVFKIIDGAGIISVAYTVRFFIRRFNLFT